MAREIHAATQDALQGESLAPIILAEMDFASGWVRFWSGIGPLTWNGVVWYGSGVFGKISRIEETAENRAVGMQLILSGLPLDLSTDDGRSIQEIILGESWQGRTARVYFGVLNDSREFVGSPIQIFGGFMDTVDMSAAEIVMNTESKMFDLERTKARRHTASDQRGEFPGDAFCDQVPSLQEREIFWGRAAPS